MITMGDVENNFRVCMHSVCCVQSVSVSDGSGNEIVLKVLICE